MDTEQEDNKQFILEHTSYMLLILIGISNSGQHNMVHLCIHVVEFANSIHPDEVPHNWLPHLDRPCLLSSL